jgi:proteic killer suppression protein
VLYPLARSAVEVVHNHRDVIHREAWARYLVPLGARLAITDGRYAVWVDENYRVTFRFEGQDATEVDYEDYH